MCATCPRTHPPSSAGGVDHAAEAGEVPGAGEGADAHQVPRAAVGPLLEVDVEGDPDAAAKLSIFVGATRFLPIPHENIGHGSMH